MDFDLNSNTQTSNSGFPSSNQQQSDNQNFLGGLLTTVTNSALSYSEGYLEKNIDSSLSNL